MTANGSTPDFQAEAKFWQVKYMELLAHSNQVIAALSRPMLQGVVAEQLASRAAAETSKAKAG